MINPALSPVRSPLRAILLLALLTVLTGCFDYREEMWLEAGGGGRVKGEFSINSSVRDMPTAGNTTSIEQQMRQDLESTEGLRLVSIASTIEGGRSITRWELEFDSLEALTNARSQSGQGTGGFYEGLSLRKEGGTYHFRRSLTPEAPSTPSQDDLGMQMLGQGLASMMMGNSTFTCITHFPGEVVTSNGTAGADEKTVMWTYPMSTVMTGGATMTAEVKAPGLPWLWIGIGLFILIDIIVTIAIVIWALKRRQARAT